jgi:SAM-dependent methyltransferase
LDNLKTPDDEIDVEEIMRKIRENLIKSRESVACSEGEIKNPQLTNNEMVDRAWDASLHQIQDDIGYIKSNWDIQNNSYAISSHRPIVGRVLVKGRELVQGEFRRYIDPVISSQAEFNRRVGKILDELNRNIEMIRPKMEEEIDHAKEEIDKSVKDQIRDELLKLNEDIANKTWLAGILDRGLKAYTNMPISLTEQDRDLNYFIFEERFRGTREDIKQRQLAFVKFFAGCKNVLDIGCGRGEFLELLRENDIGGHGIDIDVNMIDYCRSRGLDVDQIDAVSYLEKVNDKSLDGIILDQVIEHLDPSYLLKLLGLCYSKLIYGYYIVIETVNPLSLFSFINFYIDMSHKQPIHPKTIEFLMRSVGFREIEMKFTSPVADEARLRKLNLEANATDGEKTLAATYNYNIDALNNILYGPQDYAILGKK